MAEQLPGRTELDVWGRPAQAAALSAVPSWTEPQRLAVLRGLDILDTEAEAAYDDITALAAQICGTPIAAISLVDADRQWHKSHVGRTERNTPRAISFCTHVVAAPGAMLVVPDATEDPRFLDNPLVLGDPLIRFYAGAPLVTSYGVPLGSLCVIDRRPRELDDAQLESLSALARQVVRLIERRGVASRTPPRAAGVRAYEVDSGRDGRTIAALPGGVLVSAADGSVAQTNAAFASHLGLTVDQVEGRFSYDLTAPEDLLCEQDLLRELLAGASRVVRREKRFLAADGRAQPAIVTTCLIPAEDGGASEFLEQVEWLTEERQAEIRELVESHASATASLSLDAAGHITAWNEGATRLFGYSTTEMLGRLLESVIPAQRTARMVHGTSVVLTGRDRDGRAFPVELAISTWLRGGNSYTTVLLRDASGPRRTTLLEALVHEAGTVANTSEELASAMGLLLPSLGAIPSITAVRAWPSEPDGRTSARPAAVWGLGQSGDPLEAAARSPERAPVPVEGAGIEGASSAEPVRVFRSRSDEVTLQVMVLANDASYGVVELTGPGALGADHELHATLALVAAQLGRVGERASAARDLTKQSHTDPLTGLANRRRILELLQAEIDDPRASAAVLFLDLDRFKAVNDTLGHAAGDEVLRTVAARIAAVLRDGDTLARLGGDEFLVLCTELPDGLLGESVARRLLDAFTEPFRTQGTKIYLGASIGIVAVTPDATAETLLRHADIAMYRAKRAGGGEYSLFTTAMDTEIRDSLDTRNALHQALRLDELVVHYQPVIRPLDGRLVGLEALVRWDRPGFGLSSPGEFLQLAVDSGLIAAIGSQVLRGACLQMAALRATRDDLVDAYVAVNIAATQLRAELTAEVNAALAESGLPPERLMLEITEGALHEDLDRSSDVLGVLRRDGVRIALDDFGTGYSSLAYLSRLPVDVLKIDRSFVTGFGLSRRADALVDVVLELARALDLEVVVEGVETQAQADGFTLRGCGAVQGYLYSPAVAIDELPAVLDRLRQRSTRVPASSRSAGRTEPAPRPHPRRRQR